MMPAGVSDVTVRSVPSRAVRAHAKEGHRHQAQSTNEHRGDEEAHGRHHL